jgi:aspartate racemase
MGPMATSAFYRELTLATPASTDRDHLQVMIVSNPRIPDRTSYLLGRGEDPRPALIEAAMRLRDAGSELLVMPCNTAQAFLPDLERAVGLPFVPWVETVVGEAGRVGAAPVGVLATAGTLQVDLYGGPLRARGVAYLEPTPAETEVVMRSIYEFKATGRASRASRAALVSVASALHERGARSLLLACTELPLIIPSSSRRWPAPALDPAQLVARRTVLEAGRDAVRR